MENLPGWKEATSRAANPARLNRDALRAKNFARYHRPEIPKSGRATFHSALVPNGTSSVAPHLRSAPCPIGASSVNQRAQPHMPSNT